MLPYFWALYSHTTLLFKIGYLTDISNLTNPKWNSWYPPQTCSPVISSNILLLSKWYINHPGAQMRNVGITLDFSFSSHPTSMKASLVKPISRICLNQFVFLHHSAPTLHYAPSSQCMDYFKFNWPYFFHSYPVPSHAQYSSNNYLIKT